MAGIKKKLRKSSGGVGREGVASTLVDVGEIKVNSANGSQSTLESEGMPWRREAVWGNCG